MSEAPRVSVIIPTYGRPELLLGCVSSILRNDFVDFEILVVDQGPKPGLETKLLEQFSGDQRIVYLLLDHASASLARNLGIEHARGEILVFTDDDMEVEANWLGAYVEAFTTLHPTPGIVAGRIDPLWLSERPAWLPEQREYLLGIYDKGGHLMPMAEGDLPMTGNCAVPRKVIDEIGMFDERIGFSYARKSSIMIGGEDSLLSLRVKQASYSIWYQPQARAWHTIPKNKLTRRYFLRRNFWEGARAVLIQHLLKSATPSSLTTSFPGHINEIGRRAWRSFLDGDQSGANMLQAKTWMCLAALCSYHLGAIYCRRRLLGRCEAEDS